MVTPKQIADGIAAYAESELLSKMDGLQLWAASAALVLAYQRSELLLSSALQNPAFSVLGLVDANGMIDVDATVSALKETAKKHGKLEIDLPYFGRFKFDESDFDKLREYIGNSQV